MRLGTRVGRSPSPAVAVMNASSGIDRGKADHGIRELGRLPGLSRLAQ